MRHLAWVGMRSMTSAALCVAALSFAAADADARALDHLLDKSTIGPHKIPNTGTSNILVIPVHVGPEGFDAAEYAELQARFAEDGAFRTFWQEVSGGRYDPIPTLVAPLEYPDSCPIPGRTVDNCEVTFQDSDLLGGALQDALIAVLTRVRDEQNIDFSQFDTNTADGPGSDGYFDGVIAVTNIASGVAMPLEAIFADVTVKSAPGGGGDDIRLSLLAMAPPHNHEFAHLFGFIDLYGGPPMSGLMVDEGSSLSAFSRQQIGWGEVMEITESVELDLPPVLADPEEGGNQILRVNIDGAPGHYLLIENRGGPRHDVHDYVAKGLYVYSINENTLLEGGLHFIDIMTRELHLPNAEAPYMNVNVPLYCDLNTVGASNSCALGIEGDERPLNDAVGTFVGWTLKVIKTHEDGTITLQIYDENGPPVKPPAPVTEDDSSCSYGPRPSNHAAGWLLALGGLVLFRRRR